MRYLFADCVLETQHYLLRRAGQSIRLRPKVFRVLTYLLMNRDRVVPKQELCEQVWSAQTARCPFHKYTASRCGSLVGGVIPA
jgi:DNA-binding winged helix-turn-helix (wHTH) protein